MPNKKVLFWFRQDLRISDNPGLVAACKQGVVLPVYVIDASMKKAFQMGRASEWWLQQSLLSLNDSLDGALSVYRGDPKKIIIDLIKENKCDALFFNRCYEPWSIANDVTIEKQCEKMEVFCETFNASLLWEPWQVLKSDETPYKVFTPFYRNGCLSSHEPRAVMRAPRAPYFSRAKKNQNVIDIKKRNADSLDTNLAEYWDVGEYSAQKKLSEFVSDGIAGYKRDRDFPGVSGTSLLSSHLHFGELSPHQVWYQVIKSNKERGLTVDQDTFLSQLGWREFSYYLLYHFPTLPDKNYKSEFDDFEWNNDKNLLVAWQNGKTGYPFVDAGMRQLFQVGYMHNRVRMVVASFLTKNLLLHWHHGRDFFWNYLCDADLANNSASWQWVAGSGADAAPYFRIFNPTTQGQKFDPDGAYTRKFVPELSKLPDKYLFEPWKAPAAVLHQAGVVLGKTYPRPIVDIKESRERALHRYKVMRKK